jgi:hypothetical protein
MTAQEDAVMSRFAYLSPWKHPCRVAAIVLLLVWLGPVTIAQTDLVQLATYFGAPAAASAEARVVDTGQAVEIEPGAHVRMKLRDGTIIDGRFLGRTLLDPARYTERFQMHALTASPGPIALGETLSVAMRDGSSRTAAFAGYGESSLLLRDSSAATPYVVPFEFASSVHNASGESVDLKALARSYRAGSLPSAEALVIGPKRAFGSPQEQWANALRVPVQEVSSTWFDGPRASTVAITIALVAVAGIGLILIGIATAKPEIQGCDHPVSLLGLSLPPHTHRTTRPLDLERGRYVDDPMIAAGPWPAVTPATNVVGGGTSAPLVSHLPHSLAH